MKYAQAKDKSKKFINEIEDLAERKAKEAEVKEILKNYEGDDEAVPFDYFLKLAKEIPQKFVTTGHRELDKRLGGGFRPGELVLVTGASNNGKTAFCFDLTRKMQHYNCYWLPFEEPTIELAEKCIYYGSEPIKFYSPKIIVREDIDWIEERIMEAKIKFNCKVVFIDNLHYITMTDSDAFVKTGLLCKQLKEIAKKLGIVVVLIAHLRKCPIDKMPTYEDISGDSDSVKIAHKIIAVWQECKKELVTGKISYTGKTQIIVQKVRGAGGQKGNVVFNWEKGIYSEDSLESEVAEYNTQVVQTVVHKDDDDDDF